LKHLQTRAKETPGIWQIFLNLTMKKNKTIAFFVICLSAIAICLLALNRPKHKNALSTTPVSAAMEDDVSERLKWEQRRLAGPDGRIPAYIRAKELAFAATLPNDASFPAGRSAAFNGWNNRGPWNVGGRTRAFGIDKLNENNLIAGSTSGGLWRSADGGMNWNSVTPSASYHGVSCLLQDQRAGHEKTWYAGTGEGYGASASAGGAYYLGNGMLKSNDNGLTWARIPSTALGNAYSFTSDWQIVWNIALDNHNKAHTVLYAADIFGVYKNVDSSANWTTIKTGSYFTDVAVNDSGAVYVTLDSTGGANKGIWRSPDGVSFANILPSTFPTSYNRIVMGFNHQNQNEIYFFANTPHFGKKTVNFLGDAEWNSLWKYTYISGDGSGAGGLWQDLSANLPATGGQFDKINVQGSYDMVIRVKPDDSSTVFLGGTNLYRSSSAFSDSTHTAFAGGYQQYSHLPTIASYANHHPDQHVIAFSPVNPQILFSCNDGGIFKTTNDTAASVSWTPLNNGYITSMFYTVALDHATPGNNILIGGAQDNGSWYTNTPNQLTPWAKPGGGDGSYCAVADNQSSYYFSIQNGKTIRALLDNNGAVTSFARIDPIGGKGYQFVNPFVLDPNNNNIMYMAGGKYLWRNSNLSQINMANTWDSISTNWLRFADSIPTTKSTITALAVSKTPANRLYYGTDNRKVYRLDNANLGSPAPPQDITSTLFPGANNVGTPYVSCIAVDPKNADKLMVTFSNYAMYSVYYSSDGGLTFAKVAGNLEANASGTGSGPSVRWASILPVSDGYVYLLATSTGLYATDTLKGLNTIWVQQGTNTIGNTVCDMIDYRVSDGLVAIATHAGGIFSATITSKKDVAGVSVSDKPVFGLRTYPNPFRTECTIEYVLDKAARVRLSLFDELGNLVKVLGDESNDAGAHNLRLERSGLAPGLYYLGLQVGEVVETRKLLMLE
jgi:hypothetical protein